MLTIISVSINIMTTSTLITGLPGLLLGASTEARAEGYGTQEI